MGYNQYFFHTAIQTKYKSLIFRGGTKTLTTTFGKVNHLIMSNNTAFVAEVLVKKTTTILYRLYSFNGGGGAIAIARRVCNLRTVASHFFLLNYFRMPQWATDCD